MPIPEIADRLVRAAFTIYRELKCNFFRYTEVAEPNGYYTPAEQNMFERRQTIHRMMIEHQSHQYLETAIKSRLETG